MLRLDMQTVKEGVVVQYYAYPNTDGTIPWVKIALMGDANRLYQQRLEAATRPHRRQINAQTFGELNSEKLQRKCFIDVCLKDWGNIQPNDDGNELPFSSENAKTLLDDEQFFPFYEWMIGEARNYENYALTRREDEVKN